MFIKKMKKDFSTQTGFTLLETLVVLSVMTVLLFITPLVPLLDTEEVSTRYFLEDFLTQWENAQNYAVVTGETVKIELNKPVNGISKIKYSTVSGTVSFIDGTLIVPKEVSIVDYQTYWVKRHSGYTTSNTIVFKSKSYLIRVKIQLGNGRYHIEKVKI